MIVMGCNIWCLIIGYRIEGEEGVICVVGVV